MSQGWDLGLSFVEGGVEGVAEAVAERLGCEPTDILLASTGVIGRRYPVDRVRAWWREHGPAEGLVKPALVPPGGHVHGMMDWFARIAKEHPEFHDGGQYFMMSGTSQAAPSWSREARIPATSRWSTRSTPRPRASRERNASRTTTMLTPSISVHSCIEGSLSPDPRPWAAL